MTPVRPLARGAVLAAAGLLLAVSGCRVKDTPGDVANGKKLFVQKCGSCHTLERAATKGTVGPNLDEAFRQSLADGFKRDAVRGLVHRQILYPNQGGGTMPAKLVTGGNAYDVASYVAEVAAAGGKDTGILATIGQGAKKKNVPAKNGKLTIPADPSGQLAYLVASAKAPPGQLEIDSPNKASTDHNIAIEGPGASAKGPVVSNGGVSKLTVSLKPGTYTFYCSVDDHRQGGMVGKIKVK